MESLRRIAWLVVLASLLAFVLGAVGCKTTQTNKEEKDDTYQPEPDPGGTGRGPGPPPPT